MRRQSKTPSARPTSTSSCTAIRTGPDATCCKWTAAGASAGCCPTGTATTPTRRAAAGWSSTATASSCTTSTPPDTSQRKKTGPWPGFFCATDAGSMRRQPDGHHDAERDAVPGEAPVRVVGHEAQHGPHHHQGAEERGHEADGDAGDILAAEQVDIAVHVVRGRAQHGRHGQEERELGGRLALDAGDHATDDGGAGPRGARDHRHALRHAHAQRLLPGDL